NSLSAHTGTSTLVPGMRRRCSKRKRTSGMLVTPSCAMCFSQRLSGARLRASTRPKTRSSSKVGVADRATPRPEPGAALPLGPPDAVPSWARRDGGGGREGAAPLDTAPCGVHPSVSCWKSEDGNGAAREDSDIDSGVDGGKGEEGVFESGSGE